MVTLIRNQTANIAFITFAALISLRLWSISLVPENIFKAFDIVILAGFFLIVLLLHRKLKRAQLNFSGNVYLFLLVPIISAFGAYLYHEQPLGLSFYMIRANFYWLIYFVLHILNIPKKQIINLLLFIGGTWVFLTIAQQFTYPYFYFYTRGESEDASFYRAGVFRFMLLRHHYGVFVTFYFFHQYLNEQRLKHLFFSFIGLLGLYYHGARQFLAAAIVCLGIDVLFARSKAKLNMIALGVCAGMVLLFTSDSLFGEYIAMTASQVENSDTDIRVLAGNFFLYEYWPHWITKIIGNGRPSADSSYGQELNAFKEYLHYYRVDVGIIGGFNEFGIFYVINILWLNLRGLQNKFYDRNNMYLKLFFFNALMLLLMSEYYADPASIPFYCFILYLIDKTYEEKQQEAVEVA